MRCSTIFSIKFQIGFLLTLFLWGEWASNELYAYLYWPLPGNGEIKILIIADPQLIGYQNENRLIGSLTRWDADRFLSRGFHLAQRYSNMNAFVFLGDLFDEGVESDAKEFSSTLGRFVDIFSSIKGALPHFFIAGDNDIGGEMEPVMDHLKRRFAETFPNTIPKANDWSSLIVDEINYFENPSKLKRLFGSESKSNTKILLSHVPVSPGLSFQPNEITQSAPNLILSAHEHDAWQFILNAKNKTLRTVQLNQQINQVKGIIGRDLPIMELQTPTCSYRMGTTTIGYGVLYLKKISSIRFHYTYNVLWLPSSFAFVKLLLCTLKHQDYLFFESIRVFVVIFISYRQNIIVAVFCPFCYVGLLLAFDYNGVDRNNSNSVRRRLFAALVTCIVSIYLTLYQLNWQWHLMGFRISSFGMAAVVPSIPVLVLYAGQILLLYLDGQLQYFLSITTWKKSLSDICWIRDIFLAPITEEIVYRACTVSLVAECFTKWQTIFIAPLFFGISHLHHVLNDIKTGYHWKSAIFKRVFQLAYTYIFGAYATYLFLSTRHIIAPVVTHSICNSLGLPMFHEIETFPSKRQRYALWTTFFGGIIGFTLLVKPLTDSKLYI